MATAGLLDLVCWCLDRWRYQPCVLFIRIHHGIEGVNEVYGFLEELEAICSHVFDEVNSSLWVSSISCGIPS